MGQKVCALSSNLAFETLPCPICSYFAPACDFNTLQRKKIPQNISPGKISNILTMPFRYCGQNKHFMNWIQIKSFYYTKILLISYLQYESYITRVIFTMSTISTHFPPKCGPCVTVELRWSASLRIGQNHD